MPNRPTQQAIAGRHIPTNIARLSIWPMFIGLACRPAIRRRLRPKIAGHQQIMPKFWKIAGCVCAAQGIFAQVYFCFQPANGNLMIEQLHILIGRIEFLSGERADAEIPSLESDIRGVFYKDPSLLSDALEIL